MTQSIVAVAVSFPPSKRCGHRMHCDAL